MAASSHMPQLPRVPVPRGWAWLCLGASMSLVGCYVALSKPLVAALPVGLLMWLRFALGALCMPHWLPAPAALAWRTHVLLFLEAFFGVFLFTLCTVYGVWLTSAVSASVILASIPAAVALMGWMWLGERITPRLGVAIACAAAGMALLSLAAPQGAQPRNASWLGAALLLGAVLCEALYSIIGKRLAAELGAKRIAAAINLWGLLLCTPAGLYWMWRFDFGAVAAPIWALLLFYALAASVGSVWLWMTGLQSVPAAQAGVFSVWLPISAALTGVCALGERLGALHVVALALALLGVLLATLPQPRLQAAAVS